MESVRGGRRCACASLGAHSDNQKWADFEGKTSEQQNCIVHTPVHTTYSIVHTAKCTDYPLVQTPLHSLLRLLLHLGLLDRQLCSVDSIHQAVVGSTNKSFHHFFVGFTNKYCTKSFHQKWGQDLASEWILYKLALTNDIRSHYYHQRDVTDRWISRK